MEKQGKISLQYPVTTADGQVLKELTLRRMKVKDMLETQTGTDAENELSLVARLSGTNPEDLEEMDFGDWQEVQAVLRGFLSR